MVSCFSKVKHGRGRACSATARIRVLLRTWGRQEVFADEIRFVDLRYQDVVQRSRGCGTGNLTAVFPNVGPSLLGVACAFGLTMLTMAYVIGPISGCDLSPGFGRHSWLGNIPGFRPGGLSHSAGGRRDGRGRGCDIARGTAGFDLWGRIRFQGLSILEASPLPGSRAWVARSWLTFVSSGSSSGPPIGGLRRGSRPWQSGSG